MTDATFDGDNLLITLPAGGSAHTVDVQRDLYSAWKRWMTNAFQNQGYPPAFATEGGFVVNGTTGLKAGSYFFLQNQYGWRIKPAEEDSNIYFLGNLIPTDFDQKILVPTTGAFTVLIDGLQPITQIAPGSVSAQQVADMHAAHFNRRTRNPATGDEVIYEADGVTPRHEFTSTDDGTQITEIAPV